jgi:hypothetical protein
MHRNLLLILTVFSFTIGFAQEEKPEKTEKLYKKFSAQAAEEIYNGEFAQAEALYRKALSKKPDGDKAAFNFGNLYFENQKKKQSAIRYLESAKASEDKTVKHKNFHNLGNLMMEDKQYGKAVEAYKNALRNNPEDEETRYNLALAKKKQEKQKNEGGGQDKNKDQNKDKKDKDDKDKGGEGNEDKKEQDKQDSQDGKDEKESKKKDENSKKDPKDGDQEKQQKPSQPKPQKGKMSEQQIKNLLQAIENKEKNTQEKLNAKKVKGAKVKAEKDW